jgi:hypothetical protein
MVEAASPEKDMKSDIHSVSDVKTIINDLDNFKHYADLPPSADIADHYDGLNGEKDYDYIMNTIGYNDWEYAREILEL